MLLEKSLIDKTVVEGFLVEQDFPRIGHRIFLLHARKVLGAAEFMPDQHPGFEDITEHAIAHRNWKSAPWLGQNR